MRSRVLLLLCALFVLPVGGACAGGLVVVAAQGSGGLQGGGGTQAAVPASWRLATRIVTPACPEASSSLLDALGWLATGAGRRPPGSPPPWSVQGAGPFGIDPSWQSSAKHSTLLMEVVRASHRVCTLADTDGGLLGTLVALTGSVPMARDVLVVATSLTADRTVSEARLSAIAFASAAIGLPYLWGGNGPDAYDCSGLMVAAFRAGGIALPRTAQEQHDLARHDDPARPGDLAFFGSSPTSVEHVGIIIGLGLMIDAPHTGAFVRIESYQWSDLVSVGRAPDS